MLNVLKKLGIPLTTKPSVDGKIKYFAMYFEINQFESIAVRIEGKNQIRCEIFHCISIGDNVDKISQDTFYVEKNDMLKIESFWRIAINFMENGPAFLDSKSMFVSCNFKSASGNYRSFRSQRNDENKSSEMREFFISHVLRNLIPYIKNKDIEKTITTELDLSVALPPSGERPGP